MDKINYYKYLTEESMVAQYIYSNGKYQYINQAFANLFGYKLNDLLNKLMDWKDLFDRDSFNYAKNKGIKLAESKQPYRLKGIKKDGSSIHVEIHSQLTSDSTAIMGTIIDVTEQEELKQQLKNSEQRYESFFKYNQDMIYTLDLKGDIVSINPATEQIAGYKPEEVIGHPVTPFIVVEDIAKKLYHFEEAKKGKTQHYEISIINKDGRKVDLSCATIPIVINGEVVGVYGIGKDITEKKKAEKEAKYFAYYDPLTNLPNRRLFEDRLLQTFHYSKKENNKMAVMFLDIDRFKLINDSFGHKTGDNLIQMVASRIKGQIRAKDTISRLGGDEFTILLPDLKSEEEAIKIAKRIIQAMKEPFDLDERKYIATTSIGISFSDKINDYETLLQKADLAMYYVKSNGRNAYAVYSEEMDTKATYHLKLQNDLQKAIEFEEFELHYQPIIEISNGRTLAVEALLRWNHPEFGTVPPLDFIPIAEEIGLITELGEWVLRKACKQNREWLDTKESSTRVAVNVSIKQLQQNNFYETVKAILSETGLPPELLSLEITESEMMKNHNLIIDTLHKLRNLGVTIYIDDFGTGYSSLSYLKQLPVDCVKIDKSFIQDIGLNSGNAIVKTILALTKQLDLKSVAEGVESKEQLSFLSDEFCDGAQGYYFSRPLDKNSIHKFLSTVKA